MENNNADVVIKDVDVIERHIFICECESLEHQLAIWYNKEDNEIVAEVHLTTNRNFFQRLLNGIKYAFGHRSNFGDWDEFLFKNDDLSKLKEFIDKVQKNK